MRRPLVFAHRLYGAITTAHFMAETALFVDPAMFISSSGFPGSQTTGLPAHPPADPPAPDQAGQKAPGRVVRNIGRSASMLLA